MYKLIPNRRDLGSHVSNASFMVHPQVSRKGVGRAMAVHCLHEARAQGYDAMQFNFVVSTNRRAVALWQSLGFRIVGTLPRAFRHGTLGLVDAYVMHRFLDDIVPSFGMPPDHDAPVIRPSTYAVIANARQELAIVEAAEGTLLPGGGNDPDESPGAAVVREVEEECALSIAVTASLGDAVQFVHSAARATCFEKRSHFFVGDIVTVCSRTPEHRTLWLPLDIALGAVTYESHAWALKRWARLNT
jgi:8-oxo-dGTP pyrophosphatase MutT (NUDIX family)